MTPPDVDRRRERAVLALAARGEAVPLLRLVAAWARVGKPTFPARLAEGRALLALRLVDKALGVARELIELAPSDRGAMRLLAEAYLDRGWPMRARSVLEGLGAAGDNVSALVARAAEEPPRPEASAREIELSGDFEARLTLAEQFMAAGSPTRASQLLDGLSRERGAHARVTELRWALAADFSSPEPLDLQVKRALPAILELAAVPEDSEHTESLGEDGNVLLEPETSAAPFPTLFKRSPGGAAAEPGADDDERTASSVVPGPDDPPLVLQSVSGGAAGDTQILMVVGEAEAGPLHRRKEGESSSLNLRDWQASMGVDPVASDLDDDDLPGAEEAVELVGPAPPPVAESAPPPAALPPIEVIERHPEPAVSELPETDLAPLPEPEESHSPPLARIALGAVLLGGIAVLFVLLAALMARATGLLDAARAGVDLSKVLASADYPALLDAETRLAQSADSPGESAELARARMVLWSEYDGNHTRLEAVDALLASPVGVDAHRLAFLRAAELLAFRNPASALAAVGREPARDDEEHLLLARIHAELNDGGAAEADLSEITAPDEPRYRLGRARVLMSLRRRDEARAVVMLTLSTSPNLISARLLELELRDGTPSVRAAAADVFRKTYGALGLAPRQEGEAAWVEAQAWIEGGDPDRAVAAAKSGVRRDGTHRDLLLLLAEDEVRQSELASAARMLTSLQEMYRADPDVRQALVLVDLELDRVAEAHALASAANPPQRQALEALVYGWSGEGGAPDPATVDASSPLGAWAQALLAVNARRPDAGALAASATEALRNAGDPLVVRLAPRAEALAVTLLPEPTAGVRVAGLRKSGLADAAAHVFIGRYCEHAGARLLAAQHFDRAADLEPELGLALYEKGRFYADAGDDLARTQEAWSAYAALAPSGPRADRARGEPLPEPR